MIDTAAIANAHPIRAECMTAFMDEIDAVRQEYGSVEPAAVVVRVGVELFHLRRDELVSACTRVEALLTFVATEDLPGWKRTTASPHLVEIGKNIVVAAGRVPVLISGGRMTFDRSELLAEAFRVGAGRQTSE